MVKIVIADDHKIFRAGLRVAIEHNPFCKVVAETADASELPEILSAQKPHIVFMDVHMPVMSGQDASINILKHNPDIKIIAISSDDSVKNIQSMLSAGAQAFLSKNAEYDEIHKAISNLMQGKTYFTETVLKQLAENTENITNEKKITESLSVREKEVLSLVCKGCSVNEIADKMFISERTVEKHKASMLKKTKTQSTLHLVLFAIKTGLVELD
jgi:DNA-binding NarL/FixJ family response regulator